MITFIVMADGDVRKYQAENPTAAVKSYIRFLQRYNKEFKPELLVINENDRFFYYVTILWIKKFKPKVDGILYEGYTIHFSAIVGAPLEFKPLNSKPERKAEAYDYITTVDAEGKLHFVDFWKYNYNPYDCALGDNWHFSTPEERILAIRDCVNNGCFKEE
jgi:hypothetical protein